MKPLCIDLFCGLGGFSEGFLLGGWGCIGFDIEQHVYGEHRYPAQLVVQDVLTLRGSQFRNADLIVASPPCQAYSWMAMPWSKAKAKAAAIRADETGQALEDLNRLFNACFRIQAEASLAAGRRIPLIVENVKGAQPWVGRARYNFGSFYLWGDVPALMPIAHRSRKHDNSGWRENGCSVSCNRMVPNNTAYKSSGMNWSDQTKRGQDFTRLAGEHATKNNGGSWFAVAHNTTSGKGQNPDGRFVLKGELVEGRKGAGGKSAIRNPSADVRPSHGNSPSRKFASAMIAKIPLPLSQYLAAIFKPDAAANLRAA